MKTATTKSITGTEMSSSLLSASFEGASSSAKASDAAIDAYANIVLQRESPPDAVIDSSLGPYVTSLLRAAEIQSKDDVSSFEEFDSLLELLEDQCNMNATGATNALQIITEAVVTNMLPLSEIATGNSKSVRRSMKFGLYTGGDSSLDSFQSMREHLPEGNSVPLVPVTIDPYTPTATGAPSPLKPDNLIPGDLLGALDNPSPNHHRLMTSPGHPRISQYTPQTQVSGPNVFQFHSPPPSGSRPPMPYSQSSTPRLMNPQHFHQHHTLSTPPPTASSPYLSRGSSTPNKNHITPDTHSGDDFPPLDKSKEFPPLGSAAEKPKKSRLSTGKKSSNSSSSTTKGNNTNGTTVSQPTSAQLSDKELAAVLFRPARARQNSIEIEPDGTVSSGASHPTQRSRGSSVGGTTATGIGTTSHFGQGQVPDGIVTTGLAAAGPTADDYFFQQQLSSCVEILLSMNQELSEEAAVEAALMARLDFNLAQYIVDAAMTAPAICRHMLQEGCYRSDCQFSHDVDGHTCLFWIRGRCGKGTLCKFLHGFSEKLLEGISSDVNGMNQPSHTYSSYNTAYTNYPTPETDRNNTFATPATSSCQTPSSTECSASNSHSSGDTSFSFANIASKGYDKTKFSDASFPPPSFSTTSVPTVRIPQDLWNPHENRDAAVFHIPDPLARYQHVAATVKRSDVIDLHFQSTTTFPVVLSNILPTKLGEMDQVWIVTGTGHHVGSKTHQKGGGALERAVVQWLTDAGYNFFQGKDRNGLGGALLVKR